MEAGLKAYRRASVGALCAVFSAAVGVFAQSPVTPSQVAEGVPAASATAAPIAIVPIDANSTVTGALEVSSGKAIIGTAGSVTAGAKATEVILPHRGTLRVCASTAVKIAAGTNAQAGETPELMLALDQGAIEASLATSQNADVLLTPDFRILIGAPGTADLKVRLGQHGDTCVDNGARKDGSPGPNVAGNGPYVLVTSVFDGTNYRVQPGQRVMFQHGSLREVVDQEKEPCGCPPEPRPGTNDFPLAQSAGLSPQAPPVTAPPAASAAAQPAVSQALVYQAQPAQAEQPATTQAAPASAPPSARKAPEAKKQTGFFHRMGAFFRRIFGAE